MAAVDSSLQHKQHQVERALHPPSSEERGTNPDPPAPALPTGLLSHASLGHAVNDCTARTAFKPLKQRCNPWQMISADGNDNSF